MDDGEKYIIITNPQDDPGQQEWRSGGRFGRAKEIAVSELKESAREFIGSAKEIFDEIDVALNRYQLNTVELTATITASGKLSWVAASAEGGFEGGIKFVFERKADVK